MPTDLKPKLLTYLGAVPFLFALLIAAYGYFDLQHIFGAQIQFTRFKSYMLAHTYGAVIVAFLAGVQWGVSLSQPADKQYFIISNVLALLAWLSLFYFASFMGLLLLVTAFVFALLVDQHAHRRELIPGWFWRLRLHISIAVISMLLLLLALNR